MVNKSLVAKIKIFRQLPDNMLEMISGAAEARSVKAGEYIFRMGEYSEYLYALLEGKVALEAKADDRLVRIEDVAPGDLFGISSVVETDIKFCASNGRTVTDSKILAWKAVELEKLFYQDFEMGYIITKRIATTLRTRLVHKYAQLAN